MLLKIISRSLLADQLSRGDAAARAPRPARAPCFKNVLRLILSPSKPIAPSSLRVDNFWEPQQEIGSLPACRQPGFWLFDFHLAGHDSFVRPRCPYHVAGDAVNL